MKPLLLLFGGLCLCAISRAQSSVNWYKIYTGKIGNLDATVHLHRAGNQYGGYVWFASNQWPMMVYSGYAVPNSDSIQFGAGSGPIALSFTGVFQGDKFNGRSHLEKDGLAGKESGCQLRETTDGGYTAFRYLSAAGNGKLPPQYKNESTCEISEAVVWPAGNQPFDEKLKPVIRGILGMKTAGDAGKWVSDQVSLSVAGWKKDNGKLSPKEASEMGLSLSMSQDTRVMVMFENDRWITIARYAYEFAGGAHGNYSTELFTLSKPTGKRMKLTDVFNANGLKALPNILNQVARLQYGVRNNGPLTQNGFLVDKIDPSPNFYITAVGIGFMYAPYEVKSFAEGDVNLLIPFKALGPYLAPGIR